MGIVCYGIYSSNRFFVVIAIYMQTPRQASADTSKIPLAISPMIPSSLASHTLIGGRAVNQNSIPAGLFILRTAPNDDQARTPTGSQLSK